MNPNLINEADLFECTGYKYRAALRNWLINNAIPYYSGKDGKLFVYAHDLALKNNTPEYELDDTTHTQKQAAS